MNTDNTITISNQTSNSNQPSFQLGGYQVTNALGVSGAPIDIDTYIKKYVTEYLNSLPGTPLTNRNVQEGGLVFDGGKIKGNLKISSSVKVFKGTIFNGTNLDLTNCPNLRTVELECGNVFFDKNDKEVNPILKLPSSVTHLQLSEEGGFCREGLKIMDDLISSLPNLESLKIGSLINTDHPLMDLNFPKGLKSFQCEFIHGDLRLHFKPGLKHFQCSDITGGCVRIDLSKCNELETVKTANTYSNVEWVLPSV